jgi:4-amino-4-deoxy-L-arabinose transferase-like glycosyltransferase
LSHERQWGRAAAAALRDWAGRPGTWVVLVAAGLILPWLGLSGLWDPWETHYAEVARRMLVDGDWLTPRWRHELFFSKPVGIFWMMAGSFGVFGIGAWAARLPFALMAVLGVWLAYRFVARLTDTRRGLWAAGVLLTCPFYFIIARQAITDIPFAVCMLGCLGCFALVAIEEQPRSRDVAGIYIWAGLAALAKTPVGLAVPGAVALVYLLLSGDWRVLRKLRLHWGLPLFLAIAAPWYVAMSIRHGGSFLGEFFLHHNLQRAFTGVHGERGSFEYYIQQLGYGLFPWVGALPLAFGRLGAVFRDRDSAAALRLARPGPGTAAVRLDLLLAVWALVTFTAFTLIVTKFHHYVFPAVVPLAVLVGLGLADRSPGGWRLLAPLGVLLLAVVANDLVASAAHLTNLCTYDYDRPLPEGEYPRWFLLAVAAAGGGLLLAARWWGRRPAAAGLALAALVGAAGLSWAWVAPLGHTMSQQALFETYQRVAEPGEKLYQYQMNWRGEVFYSADTIIKLTSTSAVERVFERPGRHFIIAVRDGFSAIDKTVRRATGEHLHLLPGSGLRYVLASNEIDPGQTDLNPLARDVLRQPPAIEHPLEARWAEGVSFLGHDLEPAHPGRGDRFSLTLYFRCDRAIARNWQVFVHVDGHGHEFHRINGDHYPIDGMFPTDDWLPGDIIRDRVELELPIEFTAERYAIYVGFYIGNQRMRLQPGAPSDGQNRLRIGRLIPD